MQKPRSDDEKRFSSPSGDIGERLRAYAALVRQWSSRLDLVSPGDLARFEERHVADGLRLLELARSLPAGPAIDVGSGVGVPGIPLAIADPTRPWRLLEPRHRRAAFLEEVVRQLELECEVVAMTAEAAVTDDRLRAAHALVTARALADPPTAFSLSLPLVRHDGVAAVFVGRSAGIPPEAEMWIAGVAIIRPDG